MSYIKIWIHAVWATKNRKPLLSKEIRTLVFEHIIENANKKNILIDSVNGHHDHVHVLFRLKNDQTISKVIQLIKGESGYWINSQKLTWEKFVWQREYFAVSIGESEVDRVRDYIRNQHSKHRTKPFGEIYEDFIKNYGFQVKG